MLSDIIQPESYEFELLIYGCSHSDAASITSQLQYVIENIIYEVSGIMVNEFLSLSLFLSSPFFFPFSLSFSLVPFLPLFEFLALFLVGVSQFSHFYSQFWQFPPIFLPCLFSISLKIFVYSLHKVCSERASNLQEYMNWFGRETHFLTVIFCNAKLWVSFIVSTCIPVIWFYRCKLLNKNLR